ncbi:MAG: hypothetical protein BJ554DRAFT_987 [Olpidium bornovanus]|uniref:Complex 1 LYR protein domain-containing protein n=1 Tax=Olpidium bornovanus TaxID=278681 RepID=A0A8H8A1C6_9FUNG|nr:MAG: hypothetical protein BJ554DRAFT_987 [Olpidium bornovanus]
MASAASQKCCRERALHVYRQLLREADGFASYNFRAYFARRTRDKFQEKLGVVADSENGFAPPAAGAKTGPLPSDDARRAFVETAERELEVLRRQAQISRMYAGGARELVVEKESAGRRGA